MANSRKKAAEDQTLKDRITGLPQDVLHCILTHLLIQYAARTSVLSRKWRYIWSTCPEIVLDKDFNSFIERRGYYVHWLRFAEITSIILLQHIGPVQKFYIEAAFADVQSMNIDQWVLFVSRNGVEELTLKSSSPRITYKLPSHIFNCQRLTRLSVHKCSWAPPPGFGGFKNLITLSFSLSNMPLNKECDVLNMPNLVHLEFLNCSFLVTNIKVNAPLLQTLIIHSALKVELSSFLVFHDLKTVQVVSKRSEEVTLFGNHSLKDIIPDLISSWPELVQLQLNEYLRQNMDVPSKRLVWSPSTSDSYLESSHLLFRLTSLSLLNVNFNSKWQISQAIKLLANSSMLSNITIATKTSAPNPSAEQEVATYLESPAVRREMVTMCRLDVLEMTEISGSRAEMLFLKLVLASSPLLAELSIGITKCDTSVELSISKQLLQFPRVSSKAQVKMFPATDNPSSTIRFP